jgi:DNA-binding response OmpR family regulator
MANILFIEDEPQLQKLLGEFLRKEGHVVTAALNGEDGLHALEHETPDLVLLDLVLPHASGVSILSEIRKNPERKDLPVIVLTNREDSEAVKQSIELGAAMYLVKTNYSLSEISQKVTETLSRYAH